MIVPKDVLFSFPVLYIFRKLIVLTIPEYNSRNASLESPNFGLVDSRSTNNGSITETLLPFHVNEEWLAAINEYKTVQKSMLETLRASLLATYKSYEPEAAFPQLDAFLRDETVRKNLIAKWREESVHRMRSEKLLFLEQYRIRSLNFDRLRIDLEDIINLFGDAKDSDAPNRAVREYVIAKNGDTVLEFANAASEIPLHPILRFRVSSHLLAESSPLFAQFLSPQKLKEDTPFNMIGQLLPPPSRYPHEDGSDIKLYRMPQVEFNQNDALCILLHAAHIHHAKVPRQIDFPVFVSIADVCLRYQCTSPLELQVEYQWLPQWIHIIGDEKIDGFLLISYAFGLRRIFTRMSKSAILNILDDDEIQSKELWPQAVTDKIQNTRAAKIGQAYECCQRVVSAYFRPPAEVIGRGTGVGSLRLTSVARCPKGSHVCDATNLGWMMLVFNELQLLPDIVGRTNFPELPNTPRRSLKELVDCLRLVSSPPGVHSDVCDYAASLRSDIDDIYNSVTGLTLFDVSGKNGWALSKHAESTEDRHDDFARDRIEPEVPLAYQDKDKSVVAMSNEDISLRILSHLHDFDDLISAAMVDQTFYRAYKQNEAALLKNVIKEVERKRAISQANGAVPTLSRLLASRTELQIVPDEQKSLASDELRLAPADTPAMGNQPQDSSPPFPPISQENMTEEEAVKIFWPNSVTVEESIPQRNDELDGLTEKCLVRDVPFVENKSRVIDDQKNLRDEKDQALGFGSRT